MNHRVIRDQAQPVICPKPRRIGLFRNPATVHDHYYHHHPVRSPRCHFSHQMELCESKEEIDILDMILDGFGREVEDEDEAHTQVIGEPEDGFSTPPPFFCGSPPSRVANPLTKDARFIDDIGITMIQQPPSPRKGCIRGNFRKVSADAAAAAAVRIEGFDCLDRDSRNCSIATLA
ncbi:PREDICTED: uncharacterized protein LOC104808279 [Tarenaya hassleriana]|uniref:uncharacterized protein LOC104808279 n=1 Tax=Tarenaya hassleriana TaxID=28532 RepID=UPI00053C1549|nr:PREDICTED: uncharacterized protein LOC104808279 [Tarenaya hassleriana]